MATQILLLRTKSARNASRLTENGFTLMEVMITAVIAGILASIALPNLGRQVENTSDRMTKTHLSTRAGLCSEAVIFGEEFPNNSTADITYTGECVANGSITATTKKTGNSFSALFAADGTVSYTF